MLMEENHKNLAIIVVIIMLMWFSSGYIITHVSSARNVPELGPYTSFMYVPAVDDQGNGLTTSLKVEVVKGEGRVLTNIDKLLFWVDTQYSIQTAKKVAKEITNLEAENVDIIYTIATPNSTLVGGPSAGAALTIATVAALENKPVRKDILITGTVEEDGTIGIVGGVAEKASAAKAAGAELFLVPEGTILAKTLIPEESCYKDDDLMICETDYTVSKFDPSEELGIEIVEVSNIKEALDYFIVSSLS